MRTIMRLVMMACAVGAVGFLGAQDISKLSDDERKQINDWMAERAERMITARGLDTELSRAWEDVTNTSPEIETLRNRYRELQDELGRTQSELMKKVLELPALQEKKGQLEHERQRIKELSVQVNEKTGLNLNPAPASRRVESRENTHGEAKKQ